MNNRIVLLKDLCLDGECGKYGIPASAEEFSEDKTRYLRISDISDDGELLDSNKKSVSSKDINKYILSEGDIVFARTGNSTGRTYYHEEKGGELAYAGFLIKFSLDLEKINPKYLKFYTLSNEYKTWVKNLSLGSTRGNINANTFANCPINLPDRNQQDYLVDVLSNCIDKINLNNCTNSELEGMAKLLYDYWFVQFDFPNENGKPYKSSGGKMVYNKELKREIPEGWQVGSFGSVLKTSLGGTPSTKNREYWENGEFQWLNSGEIANFPIVTSELKITKVAIENSATKLMPKGTIALSITRHIRPSILAIDACANQSVVGIYETENIKSCYIYPLICNEVPRYMSLRTGAQQPHINKKTVDETLMLLPSNDILDKYYELANPAYEKINVNAFQNKALVELRDWLLPMLMNGQVSIVGNKTEQAAYQREDSLLMAAEPEFANA
jgi:type I restriction enzyme S subunit